jgi:DNA-binding XRE family transcriptional regulator
MKYKPNGNLRSLRINHGITQLDLGKAIGVSDVTISSIELGKMFPSVPLIVKLSRYFNVSTDVILGEKDLEETK